MKVCFTLVNLPVLLLPPAMDDKNIAIDLTNYSALNLVDFAIVPHYGEFPFEESSEKTVQIYQSKLNLLPLTNSQAVIVDEDDYTIQTNL